MANKQPIYTAAMNNDTPPPLADAAPALAEQPPALSAAEARRAKNRNLLARVATAAVAIPLLVGLITWVPKGYGLLFFGVLVSMLALVEYLGLVSIRLGRPSAIITFALAGALWYGAYSFFEVADTPSLQVETERLLGYLPIAALLLTPLYALALLFDPQTHRPLHTLGLLFIGVFYVVIPFILFYISGFRLGDRPLQISDLQYPQVEYSWLRPMGILLLTWGSDTAQYFAGRFLGKRKLWPSISPAKTWEGAVGGLVFTVSFSFVLEYFWKDADVSWPLVALIIVVFGILGDLIESQFKRSVKVKDSGGLLPGHGGLLDRFDSFLLCMPLLATYFYIIAVWK
jgi:phosphatidate cytidylyltransferase